jgi:hypothetical protein
MAEFIVPDWPAPANVRALSTTRLAGNLASHVGGDPAAVARHRAALERHLPAPPRWLEQVHGVRCLQAEAAAPAATADASCATSVGVVCAVLTADCLPVLFCAADGSAVAAAHAGWRGLAAGVLEATVEALARPGADLLAWLGPAIGPRAFEVGAEVVAAFCDPDPGARAAFVEAGGGKWRCDLYALARRRLAAVGVTRVWGGGYCTHGEAERFFSYRRDGRTGRMASLIWLV